MIERRYVLKKNEKYIDLAFPVAGSHLPLDHGYPLFAAISRLVPRLHNEPSWAVHPVLGERGGPGELRLLPQSKVKLRIPASCVGDFVPLTGAELAVGGHTLRLGAARVYPLEPAATLRARFVTIKGFEEGADEFRAAVRRQIESMPQLNQEPETVEVTVGPRRVIEVNHATIVGYPVVLEGLLADGSLAIQVRGIGGRRHVGAGVFVPPGRAGHRPWRDRGAEA